LAHGGVTPPVDPGLRHLSRHDTRGARARETTHPAGARRRERHRREKTGALWRRAPGVARPSRRPVGRAAWLPDLHASERRAQTACPTYALASAEVPRHAAGMA